MIKKIVIIGPESTGKSTLCEQLAQHYETRWCPEYAREWLIQNGTNYTFEDLLTIAEGQLNLEDEYTQQLENESLPLLESGGNIPLFIDTDMYVMKVWCEFVFGKCHRFVLDNILKKIRSLPALQHRPAVDQRRTPRVPRPRYPQNLVPHVQRPARESIYPLGLGTRNRNRPSP